MPPVLPPQCYMLYRTLYWRLTRTQVSTATCGCFTCSCHVAMYNEGGRCILCLPCLEDVILRSFRSQGFPCFASSHLWASMLYSCDSRPEHDGPSTQARSVHSEVMHTTPLKKKNNTHCTICKLFGLKLEAMGLRKTMLQIWAATCTPEASVPQRSYGFSRSGPLIRNP